MIYANVDSPNLGFPYFNFLGGYQLKKTPCINETTHAQAKCSMARISSVS